MYHSYPKYWETLSAYHTCRKTWNSPFYYPLMSLKYCCMYGKQCRPWSDATFCSILLGSALFAEAYQSQYLRLIQNFCVACVAWQTHRGHVVRLCCRWWQRRRCCRHTFQFHSITFEGIYGFKFKFCRTLYHYKIQVNFDIGNHPPNFGWVSPFFNLVFVVRFCSITFEEMHWFHANFAELYINVKYRSGLVLIIIHQILAELWPFFDFKFFVGVLILVSNQ